MRTVLVSMPFMGLDRPSIQLGLLKAIGEEHGFAVRTLHANLDFAALIGAEHYRALAETRGPLVGEWLFSVAAFGAEAPDPDGRLLDECADELSKLARRAGAWAQVRQRLLRTREHDVPALLDSLVESYPWHGVRVVGFSCTFQQTVASFALARRLKQRYPELVTVFGGANFDGEMGPELVRSRRLRRLRGQRGGRRVLPAPCCARWPPGATRPPCPASLRRRRRRGALAPPPRRPRRPAGPRLRRVLRAGGAAEAAATAARATRRGSRSRAPAGCWWGAKHHCTFCGLNGDDDAVPLQVTRRVLDELAALARRHRSFRFEAVDNILDPRYLTELFPRIDRGSLRALLRGQGQPDAAPSCGRWPRAV